MKIIPIKKNDKELRGILEGCRKKEEKAQKLLFKKFAPILYTTCRRYATNFYPAKDLLQDSFLVIFEKIHLFDPKKGKLSNWMIRITINKALNAIRSQKIQILSLSNEALNLPYFSTELERQLSYLSEEKILELIKQLPVGYRTVFNLFVIDGYSHQEIAKELGITPATSRTQLHKAKKRLQHQITNLKKKSYGEL